MSRPERRVAIREESGDCADMYGAFIPHPQKLSATPLPSWSSCSSSTTSVRPHLALFVCATPPHLLVTRRRSRPQIFSQGSRSAACFGMYFDHWRTDLSSHSARTRSAIDGVGPHPPPTRSSEGLLVVCVSAAHPFTAPRGVRCAHRAVRRARRVCATAEGQVLHVAPHTSPFWGGGIPRGTDRDEQQVRCGDPPNRTYGNRQAAVGVSVGIGTGEWYRCVVVLKGFPCRVGSPKICVEHLQHVTVLPLL